MSNGVVEKEKQVLIDGIQVNKLPACPKCGRYEWLVTANGEYLVCPCGAKYYNRGRA